MNTELQPEIRAEVEFLELLRRTCRTTRNSRSRPDLAIPAAEWEIKINERLEDLARLETPPLPLRKTVAHAA